MARTTPDLFSTDITPGVTYEAYGQVPTSIRGHAEKMMQRLSDRAPGHVVSTRVKVQHDEERELDETSIAEGLLSTPDVVVRAEASGPTADEALEEVGAVLEHKLDAFSYSEQPEAMDDPSIAPNRWKKPGDTSIPAFHYRSPERRMVVRRKTYEPMDRMSIARAICTLDALDYRFFIFTDTEDDIATIVYHDVECAAVRKFDGSRPTKEPVPGMHVNEAVAPSISVADAVSRLNISDMAFIFFCDSSHGHPSVLYRRYDGHYGLLVPSARIV